MATENVHLKITADSKNASKDVNKLSKGTKQATTETTLLSTAMGGVRTAMIAVRATSKLLFGSIKAGLISTGIGAFVVIIGSLVSYFKNTKAGAELLEKALAGIGAVISVLTDRFSKVGETVVKAFKDPKKAITELWKFIKDNLMNRLTGMVDGFKAAGKLIQAALKFDWDTVKEGALEYGQALVQVSTGLDVEQQKKFADGIRGVAQEMSNEASAAMRLKGELQALADSTRGLNLEKANTRQEIAKALLISDDETKSNEERLAALKNALAIEAETTEKTLALQRRRVAAIEEEVSLGESLEEDFEKLNAEKIRLIDLETSSIKIKRKVQTEVNAFEVAIATEAKNRAKEIAKEKAAAEKIVQDELKKTQKEAQVLIDKENARVDALAKNSAKLLDAFKTSQLDIEAQEEQAINRKYEMVIEGRRALGEDVSALEEAQQSEITASHDKHAKLQVKIAEAKTKAEQDLLNQQLSAVASTLGAAASLAGEGTEEWKALKSAEAVIGTATGAMQAYNSTVGIPYVGPILAPIAAALAVVTGMKQLQTIQSTEIPKPAGKARGGFIQGYGSGISDSIPARLSRGEVVINSKSAKAFRPLLSNINVAGGGIGFARGGATSPDVGRALDLMDPVAPKAFVLTDEMTNSQSRLSKIRRKASV